MGSPILTIDYSEGPGVSEHRAHLYHSDLLPGYPGNPAEYPVCPQTCFSISIFAKHEVVKPKLTLPSSHQTEPEIDDVAIHRKSLFNKVPHPRT